MLIEKVKLFGRHVINLVVRFSIYSAVWIRPCVQVRYIKEVGSVGLLVLKEVFLVFWSLLLKAG